MMSTTMQCPFFKKENCLKLYCEGGTLKFPDVIARSEHILGYCANDYNWRKCPIAHYLENYYFRKEDL